MRPVEQRRWVSSGVGTRSSVSKALKKFLAPKLEPMLYDDLEPQPVDPQWELIGNELLGAGRWFDIKVGQSYLEPPPPEFGSIPDLSQQLQDAGTLPAKFAHILRLCRRSKALRDGFETHREIGRQGLLRNPRLKSLTLQMYSACGALGSASKVFRSRTKWHTELHYLMMEAYIRHGHIQRALEMFDPETESQEQSWNLIISALAECGQMLEARKLFDQVEKRRDRAFNCMIAGYGKAGEPYEAKLLFDAMNNPGAGRSTGSWSALITAYIQNGLQAKAIAIFDRIPRIQNWLLRSAVIVAYAQQGEIQQAHKYFSTAPVHTVVAGDAMILGYGQHGDLMGSRAIFDGMKERSITTWNLMIQLYAQNGHLQDARSLFDEMPERDDSSWLEMLGAYIDNGYLNEAKVLYDREYREDVVTAQMIAAFAEHGDIDQAKEWFDGVPEKDSLAWAALLHAYARAGDLQGVEKMIQLKPEEAEISLAARITAYSQMKQYIYAKKVFDSVVEKDVLVWNSWLLSLLMKRFDEASDFFTRKQIKRDIDSWKTMVAAYAGKGDVESARLLLDRMPEHDICSWNFILESLVRNSRPEEALRVFKWMNMEGLNPPNRTTLLLLLEACKQLCDVRFGGIIHGFVMDCGLQSDSHVIKALDHFYIPSNKCLLKELCAVLVVGYQNQESGPTTLNLFNKTK